MKGVQDPFNLNEIILKEYERTKKLSELITPLKVRTHFINKRIYKFTLPKTEYTLFILFDLINLLKYEGYPAHTEQDLECLSIFFLIQPNLACSIAKNYLRELKQKEFSCTRTVQKDLNSILIRRKQLSDRLHIETDLTSYPLKYEKVIKFIKPHIEKTEIENKLLKQLSILGILKNSFTSEITNLINNKAIPRYQTDQLVKDILSPKGQIKTKDLITNPKYLELSASDLKDYVKIIEKSKLLSHILCNYRYKIYDFENTKELVNNFITNHI